MKFNAVARIGLVIVALVLVSAFAVSAQDGGFACPEGESSIVFAFHGAEPEFVSTSAAVDRFMEACPNVTVEVRRTPASATDTLSTYLQFLEAQSTEIDVYQIDIIWPGILAEHMIDLSPYISEEALAQFFPANVANNTVDGSLIAIPYYTGTGMLYYRTDLLEKYGLDVPMTWNELESAAQIIQQGERAEGNTEFWGYVWQGNAYEGLTCDALEWQASSGGGVIVTPEGEIQVNNEAFISILEQAAGWVGTISPAAVTSYREEDARAVWQSGNAAFMRNWSYAYGLGNAEDSVIRGLFDVSPLPAGEGGEPRGTLGGWQLSVARYSQQPDAAAALVLWLTSPEEQLISALETTREPTIPAVYEDAELVATHPLFDRLAAIQATGVARPSTVTSTQYNEVSVLYFTAVHSVLTGQASAADALADLEIDLEQLLGQ